MLNIQPALNLNIFLSNKSQVDNLKGIASIILAGIVALIIVAGVAVYYGSITGFFVLGPAQESGAEADNVSEPSTGGTGGLHIGEPQIIGEESAQPEEPAEEETEPEEDEETQPPSGGGGGGGSPGGGVTPPSPPDNNPPVLGEIKDIPVNEGDLVTITASATDADGDDLAYSINDSRFAQSDNVFTWQTYCNDAGTYDVIVGVSDGRGGEDSQTLTITVSDTLNCTSEVRVSPVTKNVSEGENFTVDIEINTSEGVFAVQIYIYFNSSILSATSVDEGGFLSQDGTNTSMQMCKVGIFGTELCPKVNSTSGEIVFANTRLGSGKGAVTGTGSLATITFNAKGSGTSSLDLRDEDVILSDINVQAIQNVSVTDGIVNVS